MSAPYLVNAHFLPQFYLRGFADSNQQQKLWVYEKGHKYIRSCGVKAAANRKDYYAVTTGPLGFSNVLESELSRIELHAAKLLPKIVQRAANT